MPERTFILRVVICTLAFILGGTVLVMLWGLFDAKVDNDKIFAMLGPAFNMIVGCFVGVLGGRALEKKEPQG